MMRVRSLLEFVTSFQTDRHEKKKVIIVTVDGGPDENLRYEKTINCSIKYFVEMALMRFSWQQMLLAVAHSIVSSAGWLNSAKN